eukprot:2676432-Rhodomonas_salina.1
MKFLLRTLSFFAVCYLGLCIRCGRTDDRRDDSALVNPSSTTHRLRGNSSVPATKQRRRVGRKAGPEEAVKG